MGIFDTIWRKRGKPTKQEEIEDNELPVRHITMTDRGYANLLESGDVAIKFWLPELTGTILDECCNFANTTRSDLVRQNLFIYLYGRYDLFGLVEQREGFYQLEPPSRVLYSRSISLKDDSTTDSEPDIMKDLGKNIEDLKVWIPIKMKEDIQLLANKSDISLSEMIREILLSMLIGHTYLAARKNLMQMEVEVEMKTRS